jgi:hypothetical protein
MVVGRSVLPRNVGAQVAWDTAIGALAVTPLTVVRARRSRNVFPLGNQIGSRSNGRKD